MAKKTESGKGGSVFELIKGFDKSFEILSENKNFVIKDYISTGNYMLNACMTASIFKGVPAGRITTFSGDPGTGKTFLAISVCREAQKKGYKVYYMDSEGAVDTEGITKLGCDGDTFGITRVNTVTEVSSNMLKILNALLEQPEEEREKFIFVLDSLGNLSSDKEINDLMEDTGKKDMKRAQDIKALFRVIATPLAKTGCPMIVCTHTYNTQEMFSRKIVTGGTGIGFGSSITIMLSSAKLEDKASDNAAAKRVGDFTRNGSLVTATPYKSRFSIPQKVQFMIPFFVAPNPYIGLEKYLTWETSGIIRGELLYKKEYDKLSDADKAQCHEMADENGELCYARPKDTARTIVVKHLGGKLPVNELFTSKVFTDELLHHLDEVAIKPNFEFQESSSLEGIEDILDNGD